MVSSHPRGASVAVRLTSLLLALAALVAGAGTARADGVEVVVDPPILSLGETMTATFSVAGRTPEEPDFAPLADDFEVLRTNVRDTLQIINGRTEQTKVWRLTLIPRREGTLELPAISFGSLSSAPQRVTVTAAREEKPGEADVFIDVSLEPAGDVYVQSQVLFTVRLYLDTSVRVSNATLSDPSSSDGDLVVEVIAEERSQETIGERTYQVFEQRYALFPQRSGQLELDPVVFSADMRSYFERPAYRRVQSEPLTLQVLPAAAAGPGPWLPASAVTLSQSFPEAGDGDVVEGRVGEPITRAVTMSALGLTAAQLPPVEIPVPEGFKVYPDQPTLDQRITTGGILGERVERLAMLPTEPGEYRLPAVEMRWWDVQADKPRTARLDPVAVRVLPAVGAPQTPPGPAATAAGAAAGVAATGGAGAGASAGALPPGGTTIVTSPGAWPWVALLLGLGWAATAGGWWWRTRGEAGAAPAPLRNPFVTDLATATRAVREVCEQGDPAAVRKALLTWARARWPDAAVHDLIDVRELAGPALAGEIDRLDASRYAATPGDWDGRAIVHAVESLSAGADTGRGGVAGLEPLYR